jgi:sugar/nucleoside kinase (ribokinase family)
VIAPSTLIELGSGFPDQAGYAEIERIHPSFGGEAASSAYVLARLGVAIRLNGTRLPDDSESRRVIDLLSGAGVDCSSVVLDGDTRVTEIVFAAAGERTVFGTYGRMLADRAWSRPSRDDIASSRIVCLDPFFGSESELAARWCQDEGVPYVTVDTEPDTEVARHADVLVISEEFAERTFDRVDYESIHSEYTRRCRGLVILTRGGRPLLFGRHGDPVRRRAPFEIAPRDTAGAGDSFRAGVIHGLLLGQCDDDLITTACAVAAMVCQTSPGVLLSPTPRDLEGFLRDRAGDAGDDV